MSFSTPFSHVRIGSVANNELSWMGEDRASMIMVHSHKFDRWQMLVMFMFRQKTDRKLFGSFPCPKYFLVFVSKRLGTKQFCALQVPCKKRSKSSSW